jgi:hypothetical protein
MRWRGKYGRVVENHCSWHTGIELWHADMHVQIPSWRYWTVMMMKSITMATCVARKFPSSMLQHALRYVPMSSNLPSSLKQLQARTYSSPSDGTLIGMCKHEHTIVLLRQFVTTTQSHQAPTAPNPGPASDWGCCSATSLATGNQFD